MGAWNYHRTNYSGSMWKWSNLTFHWSATVTNKAISLVDYPEFRSKFKCIVAYVQSFTELLPGVKFLLEIKRYILLVKITVRHQTLSDWKRFLPQGNLKYNKKYPTVTLKEFI